MSLGDRIASLRKRKGWTQEYLAEKVGVKKTQVTRWETARMRPSMPTLKNLAAHLGVTPEKLLEEDALEADLETTDQELSTHCKRLQELDQVDRKLIFRIIDTFARQRQLTQVLATQD